MAQKSIEKLYEETLKEYHERYQTPTLHVITKKDDICDGRNTAAVYKRIKIDTIERMNNAMHQRRTTKRILRRVPYTIEPRKFYTVTEVKRFVDDLKSKAGRTIPDYERDVILRTITKGEPYETTFFIDETKELKGQLIWRDVR